MTYYYCVRERLNSNSRDKRIKLKIVVTVQSWGPPEWPRGEEELITSVPHSSREEVSQCALTCTRISALNFNSSIQNSTHSDVRCMYILLCHVHRQGTLRWIQFAYVRSRSSRHAYQDSTRSQWLLLAVKSCSNCLSLRERLCSADASHMVLGLLKSDSGLQSWAPEHIRPSVRDQFWSSRSLIFIPTFTLRPGPTHDSL